MRPRLLLITRYFPPLDSIATMRMHSWAHYLTQFGYQVTVLTTTKQNQVHHPLLLDTEGLEIIEVPYFDPITALHGDQTKGEGSQTFLHRFYRARMNERMPHRTDLWIWPAIKELRKRYAEGARYDYLISSYGPPSSHIVGRYAKKLFRGRWIADYRDLWLENHAYKGIWPFTWMERWLEKILIGQADALTTVSKGLQQVLQQKFPRIPAHVVTNGFEPQLMDAAKADFFLNDGVFRMVYTGKLCQGHPKQPFFEALSQLVKEGKISPGKFEIYFYGRSMSDLTNWIERYGLQSWVRYGGALELADAYRAQKSANGLLFFERPDVDGVLTGKLFEYLYLMAPIVAIGVTAEMESGRMIEETGRGVVCGSNVAHIKETLCSLVSGQFQSPERQPEQIAQYSRRGQAQQLQQILEGL